MVNGEALQAAVIGAGWAGLGVSHALTQRGLRHRVFERGRIGETRRSQRWDAFLMNTTNEQTVMPGDTCRGDDPEGVMTRDAFIALLENFSRRHAMPVDTGVAVAGLVTAPRGFRDVTGAGEFGTRAVIVTSAARTSRSARNGRPGYPVGSTRSTARTNAIPAPVPRGAAPRRPPRGPRCGPLSTTRPLAKVAIRLTRRERLR
jgi:thioredoxin reductase